MGGNQPGLRGLANKAGHASPEIHGEIWETLRKMTIYLDIETGPSPRALEFQPQFEAPKNYRDPEKIRGVIEDKRDEWLRGLALSAVTGSVIAVGVAIESDPVEIISGETESELLWRLWTRLSDPVRFSPRLCGWNLCGFDLPFLQKRTWANNIPSPGWVFPRGRLSYVHRDLLREWCGENPGDRVSLDTVGKLFGLGGKTGSGAEFAQQWAEDRPQAMEYLRRDIELTRAVALQMQ